MIKKIKFGFILSLLLLSFLPLSSVSADVGPKPGMSFSFAQDSSTPAVTILSGILFECEQSGCQDAKPLEEVGPQRFSCEPTSCSAMAYGFSPYHRLEIKFSDGKTRQSNIFETVQFNSSYKVTISSTSLLVEPVPSLDLNLSSPITYLVLCACCVVGLVVVLGATAFIVWRLTRKK